MSLNKSGICISDDLTGSEKKREKNEISVCITAIKKLVVNIKIQNNLLNFSKNTKI
ncbi:MAG: hypothetical protein ICW73_00195 [Buchnera aphidicola (Pentalonia nigronervosa)]|jgi:hypothetical protein|uniref:Uncharacterized protein n=1 Tax=Buchnera aphidicola (Pentalonia nigronervosa) TaxID=1309793 RepID=A0A7H1AZJ4_9GAMM|nr:MAG: hypothetical protein ICW73_00195 [Buchnera aphidicola (Pentalonia nigronervosa)]